MPSRRLRLGNRAAGCCRANVPDQSTFTVTDQNGVTTTFELTSTKTALPGDVVINYKTTDTAAQVAAEIANAVTGLSYTASAIVAQTTSENGFVALVGRAWPSTAERAP